MKQLLFVILQNTEKAHELFRELNHRGYNGTTTDVSSISRTLLDDPHYEPIIGNLRDFVGNHFEKNIAMFMILENGKCDEVRTLVRQYTNNFQSTRGGLAILPVSEFEGSF